MRFRTSRISPCDFIDTFSHIPEGGKEKFLLFLLFNGNLQFTMIQAFFLLLQLESSFQ